MKKVGKKLIAGVLTISMLALTACGGGNADLDSDNTSGTADKKSGKETSDGAKGRYLEEEITLPEEVSEILAMKQLDGGTIRIIAPEGIYDSTDGGKTFTSIEESKAIWGDDYEIHSADCSSSGEMVMRRDTKKEEGKSSYSTEYIHVDANFNVTSLEMNIPNVVLNETIDVSKYMDFSNEESEGGGVTIGVEAEDSTTSGGTPDTAIEAEETQDTSNLVTRINILPNGNYLVHTFKGEMYHVDKSTGKVVTTYSDKEYLNSKKYAVTDNQLIAVTDESVLSFDFESGTATDTDAVLTELISSDTDIFAGSNVCITQDNESLYYVNKEGIYRYKLGTGVKEEIADAALNSLSNPEYSFEKFLKTDNIEFYVAISNALGKIKVLKYTYSADALTTPSHEVKIYALEDNDNIRQAISIYQKKNPDVYVSLEIGISEGSSATATDAIRSLNTNIVAGTGPDILILDGLPIDSYVEKDSLVDLAEVIEEVSKSEGLFENIANTYKKDGGVYAIPTKFTVDLLVANKDILSTHGDLNGLADKAEAYKASAEGNTINMETAHGLVTRLYDTSSGSWANEDGTLNKKALTEFVTALDKIYQTINKDTDTGKEKKAEAEGAAAIYDVTDAFSKASLISVIPFDSLQSLATITSLVNDMEGMNYGLLNGQTENSYIPMTTVGISAKSENQDVAKDFIKTLLSTETQANSVKGIPVNKIAFDSLAALPADAAEDRSSGGIGFIKEDGSMVLLALKWPEDEVFEGLKTTFDSLKIASNTNSIVKDAVVKEIVLGFEAGTQADEIVSKILTTVNLYLSE